MHIHYTMISNDEIIKSGIGFLENLPHGMVYAMCLSNIIPGIIGFPLNPVLGMWMETKLIAIVLIQYKAVTHMASVLNWF